MVSCEEGVSDVTEALDVRADEIMREICILKRVLAAGSGETAVGLKCLVPKPKCWKIS